VVGAERPRLLDVRRAADRRYLGTEPLGDLDGKRANASRGALDQHLLARLHPALVAQAQQRGEPAELHAALRKHPWAANVLMSYGQVRPARLQYMESLLGRLREAGFSAETTYHAYHVLDGHIFGFSLWETAHSFSEEEESELQELFEKVITVEAFPYLCEHGHQHMTEGSHHDVSAFEFGLDLILRGLKKIHAGS
jgi:Tetracyclin repressor-like, C-terminal domain